MSTHFNGEFALVLVDFKENIIILSTDAFSTKPLHYAIWDFNGKKRFAASSYKSSLLRLDAKGSDVKMLEPNTRIVLDINTLKELSRELHFKFDLQQYKPDTKDWQTAFIKSGHIRSANIKHKIFIGLSSGYDSGAIQAALLKLAVPFMSYTVLGRENLDVLYKRVNGVKSFEPCMISHEEIHHDQEKMWLVIRK